MTKEKLVEKIMKATNSRGTEKLDKLSDYTPEYLSLLLKTITNLKKVQ